MEKPTFNVTDHPSFSSEATPSRVDATATGVSTGEFQTLPGSKQKGLKVYDDLDNQLHLEDIDRISMKCYTCGGQGEYVIASVDIPQFGRGEILSFACDDCGWKTRKVKTGLSRRGDEESGTKSDIGTILKLTVKDSDDLQRHVIRSDDATVRIPAIEFESSGGDGVYTTVEGLIEGIATSLSFAHIASGTEGQDVSTDLRTLCEKLLADARQGVAFELILDDPTSHSFIESKLKEDKDENLIQETYSTIEEDVAETDANRHKASVDKEKLVPGFHVQAMYGHEWIDDCTILKVLDKEQGIFWVCQTGKENEGGWQVCLSNMRTLEGGYFTFTAGGDLTAEELMEKLNIMAEHVELEEGQQSARIQRKEKEKQEMQNAMEVLDEMD